MTSDVLPFGPIELTLIAGYLASLIGIGWLGRRARREQSLQDFYLAGRGIGFVVLLLTLYATQYSGNTLFAFTGKTYRIGYAWTVCLQFMTAIVVFYLLLAPRLQYLSRRFKFITPGDYLQYRFKSRSLSVICTLVMVIALANFLLAQLKAMGEAMRGFVPAHPDEAYVWGVVMLAAIIVIYETLGGFRAVAWTDAIQGSVLMVGFTALLLMVFREFGSLSDATHWLSREKPEMTAPPTAIGACHWTSWVLLVGIGGALYPQAIQRIYAARSPATLRKSLAVMVFLPLVTTLIAVIFGIMAAANIPSSQAQADEVLTVVCHQIQQQGLFGRILVAVLFAAVLAALMSTADSVLLSVSSMVTKDLYAPLARGKADERQLMRVGKYCSWILIATATILAIRWKDTDLVTLLNRKFDLLVQLAPAFYLGLHWPQLKLKPTLVGVLVGLAVSTSLTASGHGQVMGIHAGLLGLLVNAAIAVGGSRLHGARDPH